MQAGPRRLPPLIEPRIGSMPCVNMRGLRGKGTHLGTEVDEFLNLRSTLQAAGTAQDSPAPPPCSAPRIHIRKVHINN